MRILALEGKCLAMVRLGFVFLRSSLHVFKMTLCREFFSTGNLFENFFNEIESENFRSK